MDISFRHALVIGASSGMGEEIARLLAARGAQVALVARRADTLRQLTEEINRASGEERARFYPHDVRTFACVPELLQQITYELRGLDLVVYAAGVMPRIRPDEYATEQDLLTFETNVLGAIAWLNEAAQRFARTGAGTIVGISSVAGDRGRKGYPAYGASKAALNSYLESLRYRLAAQGVRVVTVKPGPVDTPMIQGLERLPLVIPAREAAEQILAAARHGREVVYVPGKWRWIMGVLRAVPAPLFKRLNV